MERRRLGTTGLEVSEICLGGNPFGWTADEASTFEVLDAYVGAGGNFIDTADVYSDWVEGNSGGESETLIGRWIKARRNRDQVVVATKVGGRRGDGHDQRGLGAASIRRGVEDSLRRLQIETIDLYFAHFDDLETDQGETAGAFDQLVREGKVRALGASNFAPERLESALAVVRERGLTAYGAVQHRYGLLDRGFETGVGPVAAAAGLGAVGYYALAAGFLSGKYRRGEALPQTRRAAAVEARSFSDRNWAILDVVLDVARELGVTATQVAVAWALGRPLLTCPIVSASSAFQVSELVASSRVVLPAEAVARLDAVSAS